MERKWKCQCPFFCNSAITAHFHWEGLKTRRTFLKNWLKTRLADAQLLAVSGDTFWIFTFKSSADGSSSRAYLSSQGFLLIKGTQHWSFWSVLAVKAHKSSRAVLKVSVKNKSGLFSAVPSKLASILSLKRVWRRFSLLLKREKYWQFWASFRQSAGEVGWGFGEVGLALSFK